MLFTLGPIRSLPGGIDQATQAVMTPTWIHTQDQGHSRGRVNVRDLSSAPVVRAILETKYWGIKLQICRMMLNLERAGGILSLFIPAVWQEHARSSSPFPQILWDACECFAKLNGDFLNGH